VLEEQLNASQNSKANRLLNAKKIILIAVVILFDILVFLILGLLLMDYDDSYDGSQGEYLSLSGMNFWQKSWYLLLQLWYLINFTAIIYLLYRIAKHIIEREK